MPDRPRLLDLFCGAGGAAVGYYRAGFDVVGVDIKPQPNYPFEFFEGDALRVLAPWVHLLIDGEPMAVTSFDAIHASPPCQAYSDLGHHPQNRDNKHSDLVAPTRTLLKATGLPFVMENVPGAPMRPAIVLCGSMFGLGANGRQLRRHRLFEINFSVITDLRCRHAGQPVGVYGTGGGGDQNGRYKGTPDEYREAMGIDWASRAEIAQAIPPAYTEHIGGYLMAEIQARQETAA